MTMPAYQQPKSSGQIGSDDNFDDLKQPEQPDRSSSGSRGKGLIVVCIALAVVLGALAVIFLSGPLESEPEADDVDQELVRQVEPKSHLLSDLGSVEMKGRFGAVPFVMSIDFAEGRGERSYQSNPGIVHMLEIDSVEQLSDDEYRLTVIDKIENRVKVGVFTGVFDGSRFKGIYTSNNGRTRAFEVTE